MAGPANAIRTSVAALTVAIGFAIHPAVAISATTMTVTLTISSTVAALPGKCLLSVVEPPAGNPLPNAVTYAVACSGSDPYFVTADATVPLLATGGASNVSAGRQGGVARTFTLPVTDVITAADRAFPRAIIATVQY